MGLYKHVRVCFFQCPFSSYFSHVLSPVNKGRPLMLLDSIVHHTNVPLPSCLPKNTVCRKSQICTPETNRVIPIGVGYLSLPANRADAVSHCNSQSWWHPRIQRHLGHCTVPHLFCRGERLCLFVPGHIVKFFLHFPPSVVASGCIAGWIASF